MTDNCVSADSCEHQRLLCEHARLEGQQESEKRLTKIEAALERIEEKLEEIADMAPRVAALETWKIRLNGKAEALAELSKVPTKPIDLTPTEPVHRAGEQGDHHTEREKTEVMIRMTARTLKLLLGAIAVGLFLLIGLALVAGERGWVVLTQTKETIDQHTQVVAPKVGKSTDLLQHLHDEHLSEGKPK